MKLRVLMACSGLGHVSRGYETATSELAESLTGQADVTLVRGGGSWSQDVGIRLPCLRRFGPIAKLLGLHGAAAYRAEQLSFAPAVYGLARLGRFDVVHLHDPALMNMLWRARRLAGGRFAIVFTNSGPLSPEHLGRPDVVHSVTPFDAQILRDFGFSPDGVEMVPYGTKAITPSPRAFGSAQPTKLIGIGALNDTHKGFATAIRAAAMIPSATLRLLGQRDEETPALEVLGRDLLGAKLSTATIARGQIATALAAADVFVLPTHNEGFCIAVLEAMEAGIPCVVSDIPVLRWLVGDAGILLPPDQPDRWASELAGLTVDRRRDLSERGRKRAASFHWDRLSKSYVSMYEKARARRATTVG
jgi:1,2-diacylglycerol 3-alpha-glucosyltransferase